MAITCSSSCMKIHRGLSDNLFFEITIILVFIRWAMPFQSYVQLTMLEHHLQARPGRTVKLMERSIYSARYCFVENMYKSGVMEGSEFEVLDQWYNFATGESGLDIGVDLIIYLRTTPEKALERMKERNRGEEAGVPLDYLKDLHNLHEDWLIHKKHPLPAPVLVIDADMVRHYLPGLFKRK